MTVRDPGSPGTQRLLALLIAGGALIATPACLSELAGDVGAPPDVLAEVFSVACVPDCAGLACGDGGCAGQPSACGACMDHELCEAGLCACQPDCSAAECGDGGCPDQPGACGACPAAAPICQADGTCGVAPCQPDCSAAVCGDGGCADASDAICGACGPGETCVAGQCACVPDCAGRECGDGGCPGLPGACGVCPGGRACSADGYCGACGPEDRDAIAVNGNAPFYVALKCATGCADQPACVADCVQSVGAMSASCTECYRGLTRCVVESCTEACDAGELACGVCVRTAGCLARLQACTGVHTVCTTSCEGRECGYDGCFGACGPGCDDPEVCVHGQCR